jgi:ABC-type phosphate transport system substrate-binding protein
MLVAQAPQAHAVISTDVIAAAGSDTTQDFTGSYFASAPVQALDTNVVNIPASPVPAAGVNVAADANCNAVTYTDGSVPNDATHQAAPNGSGAGKTALTGAVAGTYPNATANGAPSTGHGCIDIARSSSGRGGSDPATFEYYAFALSGVTWGSASLAAPASLTNQQLKDIYNCVFTDWSQVGGAPGHIQRYLPQAGSGTRNFFISNVLAGADPTLVTGTNCPAVRTSFEENTGQDLYTPNPQDPTGTNAATYQEAIVPYDAGKFVVQANNSTNPTLDLRGAVRPGGLVPTTASTPAVYPVRWTGSAWLLNNATVVGGRTVTDAVTNGGTGAPPPSPIVTSATAAFVAGDVGSTVSGTNIPAGAVITTVDSATQIHISIPTLASATGGTLQIGAAVISEKNPNLTTATDASVFPGVRYLWFVLSKPPSTSPSYSVARQLVGFDDTSGGVKSPLCSGTSVALIRSAGFQPLDNLTQAGGNTVTCRLR